jgi:Tfp pilus assembly protein PilO
MRPMTVREIRLLALTLATLAGVIVYVYLAEPRLQRAAEVYGLLDEAGRELANCEALLRNRDEILAHAESIQKQLVAAGDPEAEMTSLLREVETLSRSARIDPISLRPQRPRDLGFYQLMGVQLTAEGGPEDIARFLHNVRASAQLIRVDSLTCNALKQKARLRADFTIVKILTPGEA